MYRRDYLVQLLEQAAEAMGKVMFQRRNQRFAEAMELLIQAMQQLLGLNSKLVHALSVKDLIILLSVQGRLDPSKGLILADMLKAEGELLMDAGDEQAGWSSGMKSLELLLEMRWMEEAEELRAEVDERIAELLKSLEPKWKNTRILEQLLSYYEAVGRLSKAEDTLFFMLDEEPGNLRYMDQGLRMYERWRNFGPEKIAEGNLTKGEVEDTYELLLKMKRNGSLSQ